jgi:hypothetical protein
MATRKFEAGDAPPQNDDDAVTILDGRSAARDTRGSPEPVVVRSGTGAAVPMYARRQTPAKASALVQLDGAGARCPLNANRGLTLGRDPRCDVVLLGNGVSRVHASVHYDGERFVIEDQGSRYGVQINGRAIRQHRLAPGDQVAICEHRFRFDEEDPEAFTEGTSVYTGEVGAAPDAVNASLFPHVPQVPKPTEPPAGPAPEAKARRRGGSVYAWLGGGAAAVLTMIALVVGAFVLGRRSAEADDNVLTASGVVSVGAVVPVVAPGPLKVATVGLVAGSTIVATDTMGDVVAAPGDEAKAALRGALAAAQQGGAGALVAGLGAQLKQAESGTPAPLVSGLAGRIVGVHVNAGDTLRAGQVIADVEVGGYGTVFVDVTDLPPARIVVGRVARLRLPDRSTAWASIAATSSAGGRRFALLLLPQARQEWAGVRTKVEFP